MLKEIKEVGGEAGNDSTMEAKAEEVFQRGSTDYLDWGTFFSESSGISFAASINWKGVVGFGVWFYFTLTGIVLERFPRAYSLYNPLGIK